MIKNSSLIELLTKYKVVIPPIQRDYAQGRENGKIPHIRRKFIEDLLSTLKDDNKPKLELDFIYGYIEKDSTNNEELLIFKPLDGQQRITTLYLLHWFISRLMKKENEAKSFLKNFSYSTRKSSREFCEKLIDFSPLLNSESFALQIVNQPWFFSSWKNDPTINSMLVVINEIDTQINTDVNEYWSKLVSESPRIVFHLLPMNDLGLPDDLYIKMNARGKELTDFEHFKSRFSEILDDKNATIFNEKIDKEWSDLFWNTFKNEKIDDIAQKVDSGFLSYFWFISDILIRKNKIDLEGKKFWLDIIEKIYKDKPENISFLFNSIEIFEEFESKGEYKLNKTYFDDIFYILEEDFHSNKTRIFFRDPHVNLFKKCAINYGYEDKKNSFSVGEQLMLYAFICMCLNEKFDASKFRFIRNIFSSSDDQLRNEYLESFLYEDIEKIIDHFDVDLNDFEFSTGSKLSKRQLEEEKLKSEYIHNNPQNRDVVFRAEDHILLRGNIAVFNIDDSISRYINRFLKTFNTEVDYLTISNSLLTIGDYGQKYGKLTRYGNKSNATWRELFTQSEGRKGFENTKIILLNYLDKLDEGFTDSALMTNYRQLDAPIKDFAYYKIKYPSFTLWNDNQTNGFYHWEDSNKPYELYMLFRKQFNGRHWNPFLLSISKECNNCSLDNFGDDLKWVVKDLIILVESRNNGYIFKPTDIKSEEFINKLISIKSLDYNSTLLIDQNNEGVDIEDRIEKYKKFIENVA